MNDTGPNEIALEQVRALLMRELGYSELHLDEANVPVELRELMPLASQFGIGDDGAREEAFDMMPEDFVRSASQLVAAKNQFIADWADQGEWTEEKNAFVALTQSLPRRKGPPLSGDQVPPGTMDELAAALRALNTTKS